MDPSVPIAAVEKIEINPRNLLAIFAPKAAHAAAMVIADPPEMRLNFRNQK